MKATDIHTGASPAPDINVTPFIDILLVLLIIFMVVTPLRPARFKALIPEPPPDDPTTILSPRTLVVEVGHDLSLRLIRGRTAVAEGTVADAGAVAARLADERIERTVFVRAPRSVRYGEVAQVIDGIKGAGAQPIGLQVDELPHD